MSGLFGGPIEFPEVAVESIYQAYPRKENKKDSVAKINKALARICMGEIDGKTRMTDEAITFLRDRTLEFRREVFCRPPKFIPYPGTWFHQSRYLCAPDMEEKFPPRLNDCIAILSLYPRMPDETVIGSNPGGFLLALKSISKALERIERVTERTHNYRVEAIAKDWLAERTKKYSAAVKTWPADDLVYVPNPARFYGESRYEQSESTWQRKPINGFEQERQQISRIVQ